MKYSVILSLLLLILPAWFEQYTKDNLVVFASLSYYGSDFDNDKKCDFSIWDSNTGTLYYQLSSNQQFYKRKFFETKVPYTPIFADYDGDKKTDHAFFHRDSGQWIINHSSKPDIQDKFFLGSLGDMPIPTDINGTGVQEPTVWRPNNSTWLLTEIAKDGNKSKKIILEGSYQDAAFSADYDGDKKSDLIVWRPDDGFWHIVKSSADFDFSQSEHIRHGKEGDIIVPNDYNNDGKCDLVFWRPDDQAWYFRYAGSEETSQIKFGYKNDIPLSCDVDGDSIPELITWSRTKRSWNVLNFRRQESSSYKWEVPENSVPAVSILQTYE